MSPERSSDVATEQGFATGSRAQLARRWPSDKLEEQIEITCEERLADFEQHEHAVEEGERRLTQKQQDLQGWVSQLQGDLIGRESDWWAKQLGQIEAKEASSKKKAGSGRLRAIN
jgi:hypothetical protein